MILTFFGTILVAIIGLIGIIIQTKSNEKLKKQDDVMENINSKIDLLRKESKADDKRLNEKLDKRSMNSLKRFLVTEMTKIKQGAYIATDNQRLLLAEAKDEYNQRGGNSYVNEMYDDLVKKGLL
jgi:hypothetical protein